MKLTYKIIIAFIILFSTNNLLKAQSIYTTLTGLDGDYDFEVSGDEIYYITIDLADFPVDSFTMRVNLANLGTGRVVTYWGNCPFTCSDPEQDFSSNTDYTYSLNDDKIYIQMSGSGTSITLLWSGSENNFPVTGLVSMINASDTNDLYIFDGMNKDFGAVNSLSGDYSQAIMLMENANSQMLGVSTNKINATSSLGIGSLEDLYQSADNIYFRTGSQKRMTIDYTGKVGINTDQPTEVLEVNNVIKVNCPSNRGGAILKLDRGYSAKDRASIRFGQSGNYLWNAGILYNGGLENNNFCISSDHSFNTSVPEFTILTNGNVGIGTRIPSVSLEVDGHIKASSGDIISENSSSYKSHIFAHTNDNYLGLRSESPNSTKMPIILQQKTTSGIDNAMYIDADGDVGIGTTIPAQKLEVAGNIMTSNYGDIMIRQSNTKITGGDHMVLTAKGNELLRLDGNNSYAIFGGGKVGIGCAPGDSAALYVNGEIRCTGVYITEPVTADFVFEEGYDLKPIDEVESFVKENKHLPDVPSAKEMEKKGVNMAELNGRLLQKVEELTLYIIEQNKQLAKQTKQITDQNSQLQQQNQRLEQLEQLLPNLK